MHILLMARGGHLWMGGSEYIRNLARALSGLPQKERTDVRITFATTSAQQLQDFGDLRGAVDELVDIEAGMEAFTLPNRLRWKVKRTFARSHVPRLEEYLQRMRVDFAYPARPRLDWSGRLRFAEWIPDFQHAHFPEGSNPQEVAARRADNAFVAANLPRIVLSSRASQEDCHALFPASRGKTFVLPFRVTPPLREPLSEGERVLREYNLPERFFLVSNMFAPTKNHALVFEALGMLAARGCRPTVVCTGSIHDYRNPSFANTTLTEINRAGVSSQVRVLGLIPKRDQVLLMRRAVAMIQPSLFEGWNTSVEEVRALGRPLIVSDIPVHREQDVPWASYFDPRSASMLADHLVAAWERPPEAMAEEDAGAEYAKLRVDFARAFLRLASGEPS